MRLHPLDNIKDKVLNGYRLHVEMRKRSYIEQRYFKLHLIDSFDQNSDPPVFMGIYSEGRKSISIKGWIDGDYFEKVSFSGGETLDLSEKELDIKLFKLLGDLIPSGGSLMVAYDMIWGESDVHKITKRSLELGIPPVVTPLGHLLFQAGCGLSIRDWYIPEGGQEGPRKLQGFKPLNEEHARKRTKETVKTLKDFINIELGVHPDIEKPAKKRARKILSLLE